MRIGVNCFSLLAHIGGMNQYFINLSNEVLDQADKNEYIFFYSEQNIKELRNLNKRVWEKEGVLLITQEDMLNHLKQIIFISALLGRCGQGLCLYQR